MIIQALCKNNKYMTFGSHTGFTWKESTYYNLIVGQWYEFRCVDVQNATLTENINIKYILRINSETDSAQLNGYFFYKSTTHEDLRFDNFFTTLREHNLKELLND
jgi:hypothetical protein